jgi:REP element-mobilizing transposase RayT
MVRGIERRKIFRDNQDRNHWIERMGAVLEDTATPCFAWALMSNHVHLLLRTGRVPLSTVMRRLLTGYAVSFNRRYRRHGQLFQNRYKSILCQEDPYLRELVRYLHLNPLSPNRHGTQHSCILGAPRIGPQHGGSVQAVEAFPAIGQPIHQTGRGLDN